MKIILSRCYNDPQKNLLRRQFNSQHVPQFNILFLLLIIELKSDFLILILSQVSYSLEKKCTDLVTSRSHEAKFTDASACLWVASGVIFKVAVTIAVATQAKPSTGAFRIALVTFISRGTRASTSETTTVCTIKTSAIMKTVHSKQSLGALDIAILTFEPGGACASAAHVITHSIVMAHAIFNAVTPEKSLGTNTLAKDSSVSICANTGSILAVTRKRMGRNTLTRTSTIETVTICWACILTVFTIVSWLTGTGSILQVTGITVVAFATLTAVFAKVTFRTLQLTPDNINKT